MGSSIGPDSNNFQTTLNFWLKKEGAPSSKPTVSQHEKPTNSSSPHSSTKTETEKTDQKITQAGFKPFDLTALTKEGRAKPLRATTVIGNPASHKAIANPNTKLRATTVIGNYNSSDKATTKNAASDTSVIKTDNSVISDDSDNSDDNVIADDNKAEKADSSTTISASKPPINRPFAEKISRYAKLFFAKLMPDSLVMKYYDKRTIPLPENEMERRLSPSSLMKHLESLTVIGTNETLSSQGLVASPGGSRVFMHESTVPDNEYATDSIHPDFRNLDRGGVGQKDGTNFGVVCDGAGSKYQALTAAMAFTKQILQDLTNRSKEFKSHNPADLEKAAQEMFQRAGNSNQEGGSSTAVFATFTKTANKAFLVNGASVGDSVAIHINRSQLAAKHLNPLPNLGTKDRTDSGGAILAGSHFDQEDIKNNLLVFSEQVAKEDVVILASDGLVDNMRLDQINEIIPVIVFSSKFDNLTELLKQQQPWLETDPPSLPSTEQLKTFTKDSTIDKNVDNSTIANRLTNYIKFMTFKYTEVGKQANTDINAIYDDTSLSNKQKGEKAKAYKEEMHKTHKLVSKTDDAMIVVLSPTGD